MIRPPSTLNYRANLIKIAFHGPLPPLQLSRSSSPAQICVELMSRPAIADPYLSLQVGLSTKGTEACKSRGDIGWLFSVFPHPITFGLSFRFFNGNPLNLCGKQAGLNPRLKVTERSNLARAISFF